MIVSSTGGPFLRTQRACRFLCGHVVAPDGGEQFFDANVRGLRLMRPFALSGRSLL
ncbi:MAG: hypothetical protein QF415_04220 [Candidatus Undinarchaeales archaeon]|nr:hypothetical protein [Candidatus Undinarchaeales archaeon]